MNIKKAVIPVAGKGTRFLPATKQISKEIIPILNIPMIHYVVQEAVDAGIEQIVFITGYGKEEIENYFDRNFELEKFLEKNEKLKELELIQNIGKMVEITTVRQKEQLGLGHAVLMAENIMNDDKFAVLLGDDLIVSEVPVTKQLIDTAAEHNSSVIGVMEIPNEDTKKYGVIDGKKIDDKNLQMNKMVEKPDPSVAPSNLATPGRYILDKSIFEILHRIPKGAGGEYQLTDAINELCKNSSVLAHIFDGKRYDTGSMKGYLEATIDFALKRDDLKDHAIQLIKDRAQSL
jgi:UTP--glucose-1-phosphate uridylyltransferase